jgi:predicted MFS family arabinose efflux permease
MTTSPPAKPRRRGGTLWHHPDFMKFWVGETVSLFGSQVTFLALPLTAVLVLSVSPEQLGLLRFLEYAPFLLFTLVFGVWVDRRRRRPVMILANLVRALLVGLVPVLSLAGMLHMSVLYVIAFAVGTFTVLFDLCWLSYVPILVGRQHLVEANSKVATSLAAADVAGPGLGGVLVQLLTAPRALAFDALSYVASLVSLLLIKAEEPAPAAPADGKRNLLREMGEGLRLVLRQPYLRATAMQGGIWNFAVMASDPVFLLYAIRELGFSPGLVGLIYGLGAIGGVLGSAVASTVSRDRPLGAVMLGAVLFGTLPAFLLPLAAGPQGVMATLFVLAFFLIRGGLGVSNVLAITLRQTVTPNAMLGRMNSVMRTILYGVGTLGALVGGVLGATLGLRPALWVAAVLFTASLIPILLSPIPRLQSMPEPAEEPVEAAG